MEYCVQNIYLKNSLSTKALTGHSLPTTRFFDALLSRVGRADVVARIARDLKSETNRVAAQHCRNTDLQVMDLTLVDGVEHSKRSRPVRRLGPLLPRLGSGLTPKKRMELGRKS